MIKRLLVIFLLFITALSVNSSPYYDQKNQREKQNSVNEVGFRILNANKIKYRMNFSYNNKNTVNAFSNSRNHTITVYNGIINYMDDEDELAAVISHEISHSIDFSEGVMRGYFSIVPYIFTPRKFERKADKRAVDFMVNAGYNPVAMIVMMNKAFSQTRFEVFSSHPLSSRRMMYVYEYIYLKYPEYLKNNKYYNNIYYQNFLLTSQENRRKLQRKLETGKKAKYD